MKRIMVVVVLCIGLANHSYAGSLDYILDDSWEPTPAPGVWSNGGKVLDNEGNYWEVTWEPDYESSFPGATRKAWVRSNKATYMGSMAYEETYYKCLDRKVKGRETKAAVNAIKSVCSKKADKAERKAIRKHQ